jgi:hypothetical protein
LILAPFLLEEQSAVVTICLPGSPLLLCACLQMLWIHGQITPWPTMRDLFLPSLVSVAVPVAIMCSNTPELQGPVTRLPVPANKPQQQQNPLQQPQQQQQQSALPVQLDSTAAAAAATSQHSWPAVSAGSPAGATDAAAQPAELQLEVSNRDVLVLSVGLSSLLFVPLFKYLTGLPPYMGMLSGLGILWLVTDALHFGESKQYPRVQDALRNLDIGECIAEHVSMTLIFYAEPAESHFVGGHSVQ